MLSGKKIAIVGAGISGLYLAYRLSSKNKVIVFEKNNQVGGLASTFQSDNWSWPLESFYHHFFTSDKKLISLLKELSLSFFWQKPTTAIWQNEKVNDFSSPQDLFTFPEISFFDKVRLGGTLGLLKIIPNYRLIPKKEASKLFPLLMGKTSYQKIWEPLMRGKFGSFQNRIPAVWLWARIKKRSTSLGYPKGGFSQITNCLVQKIKTQGGQIKTNFPITRATQLAGFDKIIFTTPKITFQQIFKEKPLCQVAYLASLNLIISSPQPLFEDSLYWLNITDPSFPFVAIINHSGLVSSKKYNNSFPIYLGGYYQQNDPIMKESAQEVFTKFNPFLKRINPKFNPQNCQFFLNKNLWAQPIADLNQPQPHPSFKTKYQNVFLVNMEQIYPWDRGVNYALDLADKFLHSVALVS